MNSPPLGRTGIRRTQVDKGETTQPLKTKPRIPFVRNPLPTYKPVTKEELKYKFATFPFELTEKISYVNEKKGQKSSVQTIMGNGEIFDDDWDVDASDETLSDTTYEEKKKSATNGYVEIYTDELNIDPEELPIGAYLFNNTKGVLVSARFNNENFKNLNEILKIKRGSKGKNLTSTIKVCDWTPKCNTVTGQYYWVNDSGTTTDVQPEGCGMPIEENCKVECDWNVVCSESKGLPIWQHGTTKTKQWPKPDCIQEGDPRITEFNNRICPAPTPKGGRRKTRKNKKSKRKTKSRR